MIISYGDQSYVCFSELDGIQFSVRSAILLSLESDRRFGSFDECKRIVAQHHNVSLEKIEISCGVLRT